MALQRLATLLVTADKEWVLFTPDGYYAASRGGAKAVGWLMNQGVTKNPGYYPFEQFDLRLNRPDLVLARLGQQGNLGVTPGSLQALRAAREKRLKKMGLDEGKLAMDTEAPTVTLARVEGVAKAKKIELDITATPAGSPLDRLQVWANDVPLFGSAGLTLAGQKGSVKKKLSIELTAGRNKLQVSVLDAHGIESAKETAYVTYSKLWGYQKAAKFVLALIWIDVATNLTLVFAVSRLALIPLALNTLWITRTILAWLRDPESFAIAGKVDRYTYTVEGLMVVAVAAYLTLGYF